MVSFTLAVLASLALPAFATSPTPRVSLDADTHRRLLLSGQHRVGLYQELLKAKKADVALANALLDSNQVTFGSGEEVREKYQAHCHTQPLSHFDPSTNATFCQRYWMDASSYKPGGPVFVLDGGETSGADRIPFLEKGILQILSNATNGIAIVLEHRYYGESINVPSLSTDNLRWLNNKEAMEDSAQFIRNFKPPADVLTLDEEDQLKPEKTPWIYYGGSYAGARAAHMRVAYPDIVWGAIASSAVTHAQVEMPEYNAIIQKYADPECISTMESSIEWIDKILDMPAPITTKFKGLFGLEELNNEDFTSVLEAPIGGWQGQNWDKKIGASGWDEFCTALTASNDKWKEIDYVRIPAAVLNYADYIKENVVSQCPEDSSIQECFGEEDDSKWLKDELDQIWRLWFFQTCTQWGYYQGAPEEGPSIISRRLTWQRRFSKCALSFPPGKHFSLPALPDVEEINARGDYAIEMDRLAFIDGDRDPWRPMTPGSDVAPKRKSSVSKPVALIFDAIHHYDENGLNHHENEPKRIREVHAFEIEFGQEWLAQWKEQKARA